ncbi:DUF2142 domain-containing protein [Rodentibacter haemolyticus]|uniref:DUF2142 domain-containing protein n=1 Tax=Rodentibacter haemolyticus TaxID=2778911 RepID=A0ABX6UZ91_9PAST|nr:DUF2142 domain-containing protein [Rodentibacter haemolyticus]QPB43162.1 DUF2142 domain-containing protein [Rodentibacter haemolyticus]
MRKLYKKYYIILLSICILLISFIIPPLQSPDEMAHMKRSYSLAHGDIVIPSTGNSFINDGVQEFKILYDHFPFKYESKYSRNLIDQAKSIKFSGSSSEESLVNTAIYFPFIYIPQAIAFKIGELFDLSIYNTYMLARLVNLLACILLLLFANRIYSIPFLGLVFLSMPMSLFQLSSINPDAMSFCIAAIIGAVTIKLNQLTIPDKRLFLALNISLFLLLTVKVNLLPLMLISFYIAYKYKNIRYFYVSLATFVLVISWSIFSFKFYVSTDGHFSYGGDSLSKVIFYFNNPNELLLIFYKTLSNVDFMFNYCKQFIGVLGWLDTQLNMKGYYIILMFIALFIVINFNKNILIISLLFSIVFLFTLLILLITWTNIGQDYIVGVQGRYFIPLCVVLSFIYDKSKSSYIVNNISYIQKYMLFIFLMVSCFFTVTALLDRYYIG